MLQYFGNKNARTNNLFTIRSTHMSANVILKKGEGRTLKAGGAWIYDNEIDKIEGEFKNGDMVFVSDFDGSSTSFPMFW